MLEELKRTKKDALNIISDYVRNYGKQRCAVISYKNNSNCYICFDAINNIPYLKLDDVNGTKILISGATLEGIVEIADVISQELRDNSDWVIYTQVAVHVKATSVEIAKEKAIKFLTDRKIDESYIVISDNNCFKI